MQIPKVSECMFYHSASEKLCVDVSVCVHVRREPHEAAFSSADEKIYKKINEKKRRMAFIKCTVI